jgi:hypothetical protein
MKKNKKPRNEQPLTLSYTLILQTVSSYLSRFFLSRPIDFPSKMMPCKLNHNFICLGPGSLSKSLGTNLKLLTSRNTWFHWILLFGPLSKVALRFLILFICGTRTGISKKRVIEGKKKKNWELTGGYWQLNTVFSLSYPEPYQNQNLVLNLFCRIGTKGSS